MKLTRKGLEEESKMFLHVLPRDALFEIFSHLSVKELGNVRNGKK